MTIIDAMPVNQEQISHYQQKLQYEIDSWDLFNAMENGDDIVIIDARSSEAYNNEHIPGSINFPHRTISHESALKLLNFNTLYITYCDGIGCNASTKGALKLAQLGYKVKELIGGIDWWKRDGYMTLSSKVQASDYSCGCEG